MANVDRLRDVGERFDEIVVAAKAKSFRTYLLFSIQKLQQRLRQFSPDALHLRDFLDARGAQSLNRAEMLQQKFLAVLADALRQRP